MSRDVGKFLSFGNPRLMLTKKFAKNTGGSLLDPANLKDKVNPPPPKIPGVPQIDEAAKNRDEFDRIRRRRGVLATVYGGSKAQLG
jgi:hypothetical protein